MQGRGERGGGREGMASHAVTNYLAVPNTCACTAVSDMAHRCCMLSGPPVLPASYQHRTEQLLDEAEHMLY